jgi:hypothetical protein
MAGIFPTTTAGTLAPPSWSGFAKWGAAFAALLVIGVMAAENESGAKIAAAVAWTAAIGSAMYFYKPLTAELSALSGQSAFGAPTAGVNISATGVAAAPAAGTSGPPNTTGAHPQ